MWNKSKFISIVFAASIAFDFLNTFMSISFYDVSWANVVNKTTPPPPWHRQRRTITIFKIPPVNKEYLLLHQFQPFLPSNSMRMDQWILNFFQIDIFLTLKSWRRSPKNPRLALMFVFFLVELEL